MFGVAMVLTSIKRMATSLLRLFAMPSRWKYVTYQARSAPERAIPRLPRASSAPSPSSPAQAHAAFVLHMLEAISPFLLMGLATLADVDISLADNYAYVYARSQVTQTSFALA